MELIWSLWGILTLVIASVGASTTPASSAAGPSHVEWKSIEGRRFIVTVKKGSGSVREHVLQPSRATGTDTDALCRISYRTKPLCRCSKKRQGMMV